MLEPRSAEVPCAGLYADEFTASMAAETKARLAARKRRWTLTKSGQMTEREKKVTIKADSPLLRNGSFHCLNLQPVVLCFLKVKKE